MKWGGESSEQEQMMKMGWPKTDGPRLKANIASPAGNFDVPLGRQVALDAMKNAARGSHHIHCPF
jgi:hypothetical protein